MRRRREILTGLISLLTLVGVVGGLPVALVLCVRVLAPSLPPLTDVGQVFAQHSPGTVLVLALIAVAALCWLLFTASVLVELVARTRRISAPRMRGVSGFQRSAATLLAGVALLLPTATGAFAATAPGYAPAPTALVQTVAAASATAPAHSAATAAATTTYTTKPDDSLWSIAQHKLGKGELWRQIAALNAGHIFDGHTFNPNAPIGVGWDLTIPASTSVPAPASAGSGESEHTVVPGDTLYAIARADLGDGADYPIIFAANQGTATGDGHTLVDPDRIYPGMRLTIPATTDPAASTGLAAPTTPSSSAPPAATTGQAAATPSPGPATPGATEHTITPGSAATSAPSPAATTAPHPATGNPGAATAPPSALPRTYGTGPQQHAAPAPRGTTVHQDSDEVMIELAAGLLAIALGTVGLLTGMRSLQQRRRRVGERIAMPTGSAAATEQQLQAAALGDIRVRLNLVLRTMAAAAEHAGRPVPEIRAIIAAEGSIGLVLATTDTAPVGPFQLSDPDGYSWVCPPDAPVLDATAAALRHPPYPALVSFGRLDDDSLVLVDLEQTGLWQITGLPQQVTGALRAMALELATRALASDMNIAVAGVGQELDAALRTPRLAHTDAGRAARTLHAWAEQVAGQLTGTGTEQLRRARTDGSHQDLHGTRIAIAAAAETPVWENLVALAGAPVRANTAAIVGATPQEAADWTWTLRIDENGRAELPGMKLRVSVPCLDEEQYARVVELFTVASMDAHPGDPTWLADLESFTVAAEVPLANLLGPGQQLELELEQEEGSGVPASGTPEVPDPAAAADPDAQPAPPEPPAEPRVEIVVVPADEPAAAPVVRLVPAAAEKAGSILDLMAGQFEPGYGDALVLATAGTGGYRPVPREDRPQWSHLIRVLGPVDVVSEVGSWIGTEALTELAAYLTLNPYATADDVASDVLIAPGRRATTGNQEVQLSKLRAVLGETEQGAPRLPAADQAGGYAFDDGDVVSDWTLFHEHVHAGELAHALALVRGQPLSTQHPWRCTAWAASHRQEMIAAIVDVAHTLTAAYLDAGVAQSARQAAEVGLLASPDSELLHGDRIRALHACGDRTGVAEAIASVLALCDQNGVDPLPTTLKIVYELRGEDGSAAHLREAS